MGEMQTAKAFEVNVTDDTLMVGLADGRALSVPLTWYPRLLHGTPEERRNWHLIGNGVGIHWPVLDEDISIAGLLLGTQSRESQKSLQRWLKKRCEAAKGGDPPTTRGSEAARQSDARSGKRVGTTWSNWESLDKELDHVGAAVYEVRMVHRVRGEDKPVPIPLPRFLAPDPDGLLVIGETGRMKGRHLGFIRGIRRGVGHYEGNLLHLLIERTLLNQHFPGYALQFHYCHVKDKAAALRVQEELIRKYVCRFGEVPPLNSTIPNRRGDWPPRGQA